MSRGSVKLLPGADRRGEYSLYNAHCRDVKSGTLESKQITQEKR